LNTDFIGLYNNLRNENLLKTEALFVTQKKHWFADFAKHFQSICADIVKAQSETALPAISCIEYSMLYANFTDRQYRAEVWVYSDDLYLDKAQRMIGEYDISHLFIYLNELWDKLLFARKRYIGKATAQDAASLVMRAFPDFYSYLINIARFAIADMVDKEPFSDIARNEVFKINVGDYMSTIETVFIERNNKNSEVLAEWFEERYDNEYIFQDYSDLDFSGRSFAFSEFRYSQFRNTWLNNVSFEGAVLIGASFFKANMENCCLNNCSIFEVDFSHAKLKNASFINARGRAGLPNDKVWRHVGFLPVSFRNADLTNADFTGADLTGADFTGADLTGADFTGAILDRAEFMGAVLDNVITDQTL